MFIESATNRRAVRFGLPASAGAGAVSDRWSVSTSSMSGGVRCDFRATSFVESFFFLLVGIVHTASRVRRRRRARVDARSAHDTRCVMHTNIKENE